MYEEGIVAGLDIGTTSVKIAVGNKLPTGGIKLLGVAEEATLGVQRGNIINADKVSRSIHAATQRAMEFAPHLSHINSAITGRSIDSVIYKHQLEKTTDEQSITTQDLARLAHHIQENKGTVGSEIIHIIPQRYQIDEEEDITRPLGLRGSRVAGDFLTIMAQTTTINTTYKCVQKANLQIDKLIYSALSSGMAVLTPQDREAGVCLIDIGGGTADVALFSQGMLRHIAVLPFGGKTITEDIRQGFDVTAAEAEQLKIQFGRAMNENIHDAHAQIVVRNGLSDPKINVTNLARIIEARTGEIVNHLHTEIVASGLQRKLAHGIVLTGGSAQLKGIDKLFQYMTGYTARVGYPPTQTITPQVKNPAYANCIGLLLADQYDMFLNHQPTSDGKSRSNTSSGNIFQQLLAKTKSIFS
jgi:cell division protein FtsA